VGPLSMSGDFVHCLGVGSGWPSAVHHYAAHLIRLDGGTILCDCGEPAAAQLKRSGLSFEEADAVWISHMHVDHFSGLFALLQSAWLEGRARPLSVHMPGHAIEAVKRMLVQGLLPPELLPFPLRLRPIRAGETVLSGTIRIAAWRTSHLDELKATYPKEFPRDAEAFCFLFEAGGKRVGYSGDIGRPEDLRPLLLRSPDLLLCETAHCEPEALLSFLKLFPVHRVALVHLGREQAARPEALRRLADKTLGPGRCLIPQEGERIEL